MSAALPAISRYPVPAIEGLPEDMRKRILEVQEKSGFVPNVFLAFAHRPEEARARAIQEWDFCAAHSQVGWRRVIRSIQVENL